MRYVYLNTCDRTGKRFQFLSYSRDVANQFHGLNGGTIHRLSYGYFKDCGKVMDGPTIRAVGEIIAPGTVRHPIPVDAQYSLLAGF